MGRFTLASKLYGSELQKKVMQGKKKTLSNVTNETRNRWSKDQIACKGVQQRDPEMFGKAVAEA